MTIGEIARSAESIAAVLEVVPGLVDDKHVKNLERLKDIFESIGNLSSTLGE